MRGYSIKTIIDNKPPNQYQAKTKKQANNDYHWNTGHSDTMYMICMGIKPETQPTGNGTNQQWN